MKKTFLENINVERVLASQAAGTDDTLNSSIVDMAEYDRVAFIASLGTVTASGVATLKIYAGDASDLSDGAYLSGAEASGTTGDSDKQIAVEVGPIQYRYVRADIVRATANAEIDDVTAFKTGAIKTPVDTTDFAGVTIKAY